jgi:uncharacterized membrane protein
VNPFDLKAALLAKHAQHVVVIHFPIALFLVSFAFDLLALWRRDRSLATAAYYNLIAAAVTTLPAVVTGLLAWQWQYGGKRLRGNLRLHLILGLVSSSMIWLVSWLHFRQRRKPGGRLTAAYLSVELVAVAVITLTGHLGGILSGVEAPTG